MKVTVRKYLNVRVGSPSLNAPCYQYLAPGSELEVDGQTYPGDLYDGIASWMRDAANNYYWSGALDQTAIEAPAANLRSGSWYDVFNLAAFHKTERGERARVLILDTGFNAELAPFSGALAAPLVNCVAGSTTGRSIDPAAHGTHCAGLIAARDGQYQVAAAPGASLLVAKVSDTGQLDDAGTMKQALQQFLDDKYDFDIISISQTVMNDDPEFLSLLQAHIRKNRIVVAAVGNDSQNRNSLKKRYPGFYPDVIAVGACNPDGSIATYTCYPSRVDVFCYGTDIPSYRNNVFPEPLSGTSQATAILAGICALVVSGLRKKGRTIGQAEMRTLLRQTATPITGAGGAFLVSPDNLLNYLSNT